MQKMRPYLEEENLEIKLVNKKVTLECPRCHWIFEAYIPDGHHSSASFDEPKDSGVIQESHTCRNPKCRKQSTIYWYDKEMHVNRI